jgi:hypothetical protein
MRRRDHGAALILAGLLTFWPSLGLTWEITSADNPKILAPVVLSSEPMAFKIETDAVRQAAHPEEWANPRHVVARGAFDDGATERLRRFVQGNGLPAGTWVWLSSPGGLVREGIEMGKLLRQLGFNTTIAGGLQFGPNLTSGYEGACLSSCTLAFLGGVKREVNEPGYYGVHRARVQQSETSFVDQIAGAEIYTRLRAYVVSMGADPRLVDEMLRAGPERINLLSDSELRALGVIHSPPRPCLTGLTPNACGVLP